MRPSCRSHRSRPGLTPVEAVHLLDALLAAAPEAGIACVWLGDDLRLLDLFAVAAGHDEVEEVAGVVLDAPWSPVGAIVLASVLPPGRDTHDGADVARWRALDAHFALSPIMLLDWFVRVRGGDLVSLSGRFGEAI